MPEKQQPPSDWSALIEADLRHGASPEVMRRGREYHRQGAVASLVLRGDALEAEVEGSEPEPYAVHAVIGACDITSATCTCPYDFGGWCKHILAALLAYLDDPAEVERRPGAEELLSALGRDQLQAVLLGLLRHDPALTGAVERQVSLLAAEPRAAPDTASPPPPAAPTDVETFRRQVRSSSHPTDGASDFDALPGPDEPLDRAWQHIVEGDGRRALDGRLQRRPRRALPRARPRLDGGAAPRRPAPPRARGMGGAIAGG